MTTIVRLVRGADLRHHVTLPELAESYGALTCQARCGEMVDNLSVRALDGMRVAEVHAPSAMTADWPLRLVSCAVRATVDGEVAHSETFLIHVLPEVATND